MPVINDATVINQAYDTSGNGGRKLVRLDNGNQFVAVKDGAFVRLYWTVDNWNTKQEWVSASYSSIQDVAIQTDGENVFMIYAGNNNAIRYHIFDSNGVSMYGTSTKGLSTESATGNVSLAINEAGTELHAAWSSKNATYPNSFNIRYAKGTINADGSVTWGSVEQLTTASDTTINMNNPTITIDSSGYYHIIFTFNHSVTNALIDVSKRHTTKGYNNAFLPNNALIYNGASYTQGSPSAIFVPKSINGLANGRIWVAWHGKDAIDTSTDHIRTSYSDDGGATWSSAQKLTSGSVSHLEPSITANKNSIFILCSALNGSNSYGTKQLTFNGVSWSAKDVIVGGSSLNRSRATSMFDHTFSLKFTSPLFIYRDNVNNKVGFYGTWLISEISVPQGSIGKILDKNNLLTYSITSDGEMGEVIEKVNGVIVGTKTAVSGESLTVGLSQEQWDAVKFGRYSLTASTEVSTLIPKFSLWNSLSPQGKILGDYKYTITVPGTTTVYSYVDIPCLPNQEYTFNIVTDGYCSVVEYDSSKLIIGSTTEGWINSFPKTFLTKSNAAFLRVHVGNGNQGAGTYNFKNPVLALGKSAPLPIEDNKINTLTIEMGENKWEYTFDKQLSSDADMLSIVKAVKDSQDTYLPAVKTDLAKSVTSKGVVTSPNDAFEVIAEKVGQIPLGKKFASGTGLTSASAMSGFLYASAGTAFAMRYLEVSGLNFKPSTILIIGSSINLFSFYTELPNTIKKNVVVTGSYPVDSASMSLYTASVNSGSAYVTESGFLLPTAGTGTASQTVTWIAYE